jgi:ATP-dependent DNA ligase
VLQIARRLKARDAVLDSEIVCLDVYGRSQFKSLMYHINTRPDPRLDSTAEETPIKAG